jgi:hypothetical protein
MYDPRFGAHLSGFVPDEGISLVHHYSPLDDDYDLSAVNLGLGTMYYPDHGHSQHSQHSQQQQQHSVGFPFGAQPSPSQILLSDYQRQQLVDTPSSSMDDHMSPAAAHNENGKRPSFTAPLGGPSRKRVRKDSDLDPDASAGGASPQDSYDPNSKEGKPKATRGARYVHLRPPCLISHIVTQRMHSL